MRNTCRAGKIFWLILALCGGQAFAQSQPDNPHNDLNSPDRISAPKELVPVPVSGKVPFGFYNESVGSNRTIETDLLLVGDGFNSATNEGLSNCVEFDGEKDLVRSAGQSAGQTVDYTFRQITTFQSLKTYLNISASASVGSGIYSGDASVNMMSSGDFSEYSNYVMVDVVVKNPTEQLRRRHLTASALHYASQGALTFFEMCGNNFMYARQTGGRLTGILRFSSKSAAEQKSLSASLDVAVGAFASGKASVQQTINTLSTYSATDLRVIRSGGLGSIPTAGALLDASLNFPNLVRLREQQNAGSLEQCKLSKHSDGSGKADDPCVEYEPVVFSLVTRGYNSVDNLPGNVQDFSTIEAQERALSSIGSFLDKAYSIKGNLTYINIHPEEFEAFSPEQWKVAWNKNEALISSLLSAADRCKSVKHAQNCSIPDPPDFTNLYEPQRAQKACETHWVSSVGSAELTESFTHDDTSGIFGVHRNNSGTFNLSTPNARINSVTYRCIGGTCGWSYNPDGGYAAKYELINNNTGFVWHRLYQNSQPITEIYTAHISVQVNTCAGPLQVWTMPPAGLSVPVQ